MYSFPTLESVHYSMSTPNCCFLAGIQISQEVGKVLWYSNLLKNFSQFLVIHIVKGFGIVNGAEEDVFLELFCFIDDPTDVGDLISCASAFSSSKLSIWKFLEWNENQHFPVLWPMLSFLNLLANCVQHFHSSIFQGANLSGLEIGQLECHQLH